MTRDTVTLIDADRNVVARADVRFLDGFYSGSVDVNRMPEALRALFEEYEEIVNGQILSLLDRIEDRISAVPLVVVFDDGHESQAVDLQIFPGEGVISFKVPEPAALRRG